MKNKLLENAKLYIKRGNCNNIDCSDCPASRLNSITWCNEDKNNIKWFKNYIKQNEEIQMTPIFDNEEQFINIMDEILETQNDEHDETINRMLVHAKEKGYIKKSIVDEAIEYYEKWENESNIDTCHKKLYYAILHLLEKQK